MAITTTTMMNMVHVLYVHSTFRNTFRIVDCTIYASLLWHLYTSLSSSHVRFVLFIVGHICAVVLALSLKMIELGSENTPKSYCSGRQSRPP